MHGVSKAATILYAAVFLDLLGFGMLIPDFQLRAERLGAPGWLIGGILASMFVVQVPISPMWGKLSDRIGRKPVYLLCTGFSAGGMLVYGFAVGLPLLAMSRLLSGFGGANVAVAQAMLADATQAEDRTVAMGRISASVSLGLIAGPVVGGLVSGEFGSHAVGWIAGASSALGGLLVMLLVPAANRAQGSGGLPSAVPAPAGNQNPSSDEGKPALERSGGAAVSGPDPVRGTRPLQLLNDYPQVRGLAIIAAVSWFALATLEGTFGRLILHTLGFGASKFGLVFGFESLLGFIVQAWLLGWVSRKVGETPLLRTGFILQGLGLALTPFTYLFPVRAAWFAVLLACSAIYALGSALANPTINSLCSKLTPDERQGELFGLLQGARSVGFIFGPIVGGAMFDRWFAAPYLLAGATCCIAAVLIGIRPKPTQKIA